MNDLYDAVATYRLARLVVEDSLLDVPRARLVKALNAAGHHKATELLDCYWCSGMWIAFGVVIARRTFPRAWDPIARALTYSAATGIIDRFTL